MIKNISLIGAGAVGCIYGKDLYELDSKSFNIIAEGERLHRYRENGFIINGKKYDFNYITPDEKGEDDLIIVAVKENKLEEAIKNIRNRIGKNTIILSLLNGITSEEIIGKEYGIDKLLYSLCIIQATRKGNKVHAAPGYKIVFGEKENKVYSKKVQEVKELFERAQIPYEIPENMLHSLWSKFMFNVGINPTSAILKGDYGLFQKKIEAKEVMDAAMREVIILSQRVGANLNEEDIKAWHKVLDRCEPDGTTSMCQDILAGRKTEIDMFSGTVCKLGEKYGIKTPVNKLLLNLIKAIE